MKSILIMAGGEQTRWTGDAPKQLVDIDGTPLLVRTLEQCRELFNVEPTVITDNDEIATHCQRTFWNEDRCRWTVESALGVSDLWGEYTIFLLGDVYYTDYALETIATVPRRVVFGDEVEIYGVHFRRNRWGKAIKAFNSAISYAETGKQSHVESGKFWHFYRFYAGIKPELHKLDGNYCLIEDETQDFDYVEDYEQFLVR